MVPCRPLVHLIGPLGIHLDWMDPLKVETSKSIRNPPSEGAHDMKFVSHSFHFHVMSRFMAPLRPLIHLTGVCPIFSGAIHPTYLLDPFH